MKKFKFENYKKSEDWIYYELLQVGIIYLDFVRIKEGKELKMFLWVFKRFEDILNCCLIFVCFFVRLLMLCLCVICRVKFGVYVKIFVDVNLDIRGVIVKLVGRIGNIKFRVFFFWIFKVRERDFGMVWLFFVLIMR